MRRNLAVILLLTVLLTLVACGGNTDDGTLTLYIPEKAELYQGDGTLYATINYVYEEGWQDKESFTVTLTGDTDKLGGASSMVYSEKKVEQEVSNGAKMETYYDAKGLPCKTINLYANGGRREVTRTYDNLGRVTSETEKIYEADVAEPTTTTRSYTYTDTETGSTCTYTIDPVTYVITYDKNGRQTSQVAQLNGKENGRTEMTYDSVGNPLKQISYANGQKNMEMKYTYKAVKVSAETAARLPQFKSAK